MTKDGTSRPARKIHPALTLPHWPRVFTFILFAILVADSLPRDSTGLIVGVLSFGLLYPAAFLFVAKRTPDTKAMGHRVMVIDAVAYSLAVVVSSYAIIPLLVSAELVTLGPILVGGMRLMFRCIVPYAIVLIAGLAFVPFQLALSPSWTQVVVAYVLVTGLVAVIFHRANFMTRRFVAGRSSRSGGSANA